MKTKRTPKIYKLIDHSFRPSRLRYICAMSKKECAEILDKPLTHINNNLSLASSEETAEYRNLAHGDSVVKSPEQAPTRETLNLTRRDIEKVATVGYIASAERCLQAVDLDDVEQKERLHEILGALGELRADICEKLEKAK